jgi:hypothetical protein
MYFRNRTCIEVVPLDAAGDEVVRWRAVYRRTWITRLHRVREELPYQLDD